ncbi:hypothetical protein BT96DRAFT_1010348 [Gymnopus androsaceus JB14]|uniref:Uncharacterized protein n=1 Tax=Gymnopus androsaceus JB14 TaxID=1447944 RepID=A0A6A4GAW3_9AGAR|nr:hypothetical protein BT96DRAFT_1010348 [Gymnopus androsaceus JB14]
MIHDSALIVGLSALVAIGVVDASAPSRLDILVGCDHSKALHNALRNSGFYLTPDTIKSHYTRTIHLVWSYHKQGYKSINVIETINSTVWMHILASPSTAHTAFMSATHVFVLHPELTFCNVALLRNTDFPPWQQDHVIWTRLLELGWVRCGVLFGEVKVFGIVVGLG